MSEFTIGQRWISNTEASLGLGLVMACAGRRVTINFPAVGEERVYAIDNAPLNRISYKVGERVWLEARELAKQSAGADFDLKEWHNKALKLGPMGLAQMKRELT